MLLLLLAGQLGCGEKESESSLEVMDTATEEETQTATWEDITSIVETYYDPTILPSIGAARISNGELTHLGTIGLRSLSAEAEVTAWDKWHLGSCTKAMTASLAGIMVDEGYIRWDSTMEELFPNIEVHPDYQAVTIEMMLSHTGGAWGYLPEHEEVWSMMVLGGNSVDIRADIAEDVLIQTPEVQPGTQFLYSNTGYMLVGAALERVSGSSWEELMQDKIFQPLEMSSCGFGPQDDGSLAEPWSHYGVTPIDPLSGNADNPASLGPAGTVHCSLPDWSKFIMEQLKLYRGEGRLLSPTQSQQLFTAQLDGYAMGWVISSRSWADGEVFMHTGSNVKNYAVVWAAPERNEAYLTVTNTGTEEAYLILDQVTGELIGLD